MKGLRGVLATTLVGLGLPESWGFMNRRRLAEWSGSEESTDAPAEAGALETPPEGKTTENSGTLPTEAPVVDLPVLSGVSQDAAAAGMAAVGSGSAGSGSAPSAEQQIAELRSTIGQMQAQANAQAQELTNMKNALRNAATAHAEALNKVEIPPPRVP